MKIRLLTIFSFCFTLIAFAQQGTLKVNVEKMNTLEGKIYIGVYTEQDRCTISNFSEL